MAELVTVNRFAIREFAALPLKKSTLDGTVLILRT